ncbi:MAG: DNA-binding protein WhiA [Erysipelotrichaceae bacterium]|nr:DNA-binding protein WhiA [Erysipelotrichaceae bacterium]
MSFASEVKEELSRAELEDHAAKARLCAMVQLLSSLSISRGKLSLAIRCHNATIARTVVADFRQVYDIRADLSVLRSREGGRNRTYEITISDNAKDILTDLDLWTERGLQSHPRMSFLSNDDMNRAYLAGSFLAGGSVNSAKSSDYHMEFAASDESHASFIVRLLGKFYVNAKTTTRRGKNLAYIKASQQIADTLSLLGAYNALFEFEDIRIQRDFVNNNRRLNNTEIANEIKSQQVAQKQYEAASYLKDHDLINLLSEKDREIADLRLRYSDASLNELAQYYEEMYGLSISKSGIRHRFEKILALAEKHQLLSGEKNDQ